MNVITAFNAYINSACLRDSIVKRLICTCAPMEVELGVCLRERGGALEWEQLAVWEREE